MKKQRIIFSTIIGLAAVILCIQTVVILKLYQDAQSIADSGDVDVDMAPSQTEMTICGSFTATVRELIPNYVWDDTTPMMAVVTCFQDTPFIVSLSEEQISGLVLGETYVFEIAEKQIPSDTAVSTHPRVAIPFYHLQIQSIRIAEDSEIGLDAEQIRIVS